MGYQVSTGDDDFHLARREMGNAKAAENEEIGDKCALFFGNFKIGQMGLNEMGNGFSSFLNLNGTLKHPDRQDQLF